MQGARTHTGSGRELSGQRPHTRGATKSQGPSLLALSRSTAGTQGTLADSVPPHRTRAVKVPSSSESEPDEARRAPGRTEPALGARRSDTLGDRTGNGTDTAGDRGVRVAS